MHWLLLQLLFASILAVPFAPCPSKGIPTDRKLHIITCDTRSGFKEYQGLAMWNVSTYDLRKQGVVVKNICSKGVSWEGFITKPTQYLAYVESQLKDLDASEDSQLFALLMDSDTLFSGVTSVATLWALYDCVLQGGRPNVVVAAETSCWVGQFCTPENITKYYSGFAEAPSYSPFMNAGVLMGPMHELAAMMAYVVGHHRRYHLHSPHLQNAFIFEDQFAITDYCLQVNPDACTIDYHQQLAASYALNFQSSLQEPVPKKFTFVCRTLSNEISYNCPDVTWKVLSAGMYYVNKDTCAITRQWIADLKNSGVRDAFKTQLQSLAPTAAIYHGNGFGKKAFARGLARQSFECMLHSRLQMNFSTYYLHNTYETLYNMLPPQSKVAYGTIAPQTISMRRPELKSKMFYIYPLGQEYWWRWPTCPDNHLFTGYQQNSGIGAVIDEAKGIFNSFQHSLFNSLLLRLQRSHRRTLDPAEASLFVIPYDYSMAKRTALDCVNKRRNKTYCPEEMQFVSKFITNTPQFKRYNGVDHVLITSLGGPFSSEVCANLFQACEECAITCYWAEPNGNDTNFVSIPFPSYYHFQVNDAVSGSNSQGVFMPWTRPNRTIFSTYAGSKGVRVRAATLIRKQLVKECQEQASHCNYVKVDRVWSKLNSIVETEVGPQLTVEIMEAYSNSIFCFCPPGDDPSRRAIIDILVSGCIPVVFSALTLHNGQYPWFIGEEMAPRVSVFVPPELFHGRHGVLSGGVIAFLRSIDNDVVQQKLRDIALLSPQLQYSIPPVKDLAVVSDVVLQSDGQSGRYDPPFLDAMDVTVDGLIDRAERGIANKHLAAGIVPKPLIPGLKQKARKDWERDMNEVIF